MSKKGSRFISINQYRFTDLFIFLLILAVGELLQFFAMKWFPRAALYTVSFMVPITLIVMIRWGWPSVIYALLSGVIYCALNQLSGVWYATYIIGNAFIALLLIPIKFIGKEKIIKKWWATLLFVVAAWVLVYLGRSAVFAIGYAILPVENAVAYSGLITFAVLEALSLALAIAVMLVLRRLDGLLEDQHKYIRRLDKERKEKQKIDEYGDVPIELDEATLEILKRDNDLYD